MSSNKNKGKRFKRVLPLKLKIELLDKLRDENWSVSSLARLYGLNESTVRTIKKSESKIRGSSGSEYSKIVRDPAIEKMEEALSLWLYDNDRRGIPQTGANIREKAKKIFQQFSISESSTSNTFLASKGWLDRFKIRYAAYSTRASLVDKNTTDQYTGEFLRFIEGHGYTRDQVFNADGTALYWKRMPQSTFIYRNEKCDPDFNSAQDRISLLLCGNASGDCVIKPLVVSKAEYSNFTSTACLSMFWRINENSWITPHLFMEWFTECFAPEVENYLRDKDLDFKAVLLVDSALLSSFNIDHPNIKVYILPAIATALLQPTDQGIIEAFKLYYFRHTFKYILGAIENDPEQDIVQTWRKYDMHKCVNFIKHCMDELREFDLAACWAKIWPGKQFERDDLVIGDTKSIVEDIARIAEKIGEGGFDQLTPEDIREAILTPEDDPSVQYLEVTTMKIKSDPDDDANSTPDDEMTTKSLSVGIKLSKELSQFFIDHDPSSDRSITFKRQINQLMANYIDEYRNLKEKKKKNKPQESQS